MVTVNAAAMHISGGDWLAELHEGVGEMFLAVVLAHVGLIAVVSLLRRRNLGRTMLTGRVAGVGPDLVRRNRRWLAVLLFVGVTGFIGWLEMQPPDIEPMPLSAIFFEAS